MMSRNLAIIAAVSLFCALNSGGCEKDDSSKNTPPTQNAQSSKPTAESPEAEPATTGDLKTGASADLPPSQPPSGAATSGNVSPETAPPPNQQSGAEGSKLALTGLSMTVPEGWRREQAKPGPMAPKAVFKLSGADGDQGGVSVRITHFPGMKGLDNQNIDRWISQVRQPDGQPSTRDHATVTVKDLGAVKLTLVDITGSVNTSMRGQGEAKPNQRLIAAIVDHPKGPHFVKASGDVAAIKKWEASIMAFIESAQVN